MCHRPSECDAVKSCVVLTHCSDTWLHVTIFKVNHPACVKAAVSAPTPENTHQYSSACPGLWSLKTNLLLAAAFKLTFFFQDKDQAIFKPGM